MGDGSGCDLRVRPAPAASLKKVIAELGELEGQLKSGMKIFLALNVSRVLIISSTALSWGAQLLAFSVKAWRVSFI